MRPAAPRVTVTCSIEFGVCATAVPTNIRKASAVKPRKIEASKGSKFAPDLTRRREPLEAYPLESLAMVGTLEKGKTLYALVRTPERDIYQVRQGNYLGQNYGVVIGISEADMKLKELVQDGSGDWAERSSTLNLQQAPEQRAQGSRR